ncbi:MAG: NUDIX domain-containing protein [Spirochaetota bacterium]
MYPVRNSAKAIIIENNRLLCIRKTGAGGHYCILPGGGQEKNETFIDAVKRECREEIGAEVAVQGLTYIREYIARNHEFKEADDLHQVEFMFECELLTRPNMENASHLDGGQDGIVWVDIAAPEYAVYPKVLLDRIRMHDRNIYWGDVN